MGGDIFVDVHVLVSPWISVSEGHQIAQRVHFELMEANSQIKDVTVHIDPEDDELILPSLNLPSRPALEKKLFHKWTQQFPNIQSIVLHYLDGQIKVEIKLDKKFKKWSELELMVREDFSLYPAITAVELLYHHTLMQRVEQKG
jgi:hypothetical protein